MFRKLMLKVKVNSLEIPNIKKRNRLNMLQSAYDYLLENYSSMTDAELVMYIRRECIRMAFLNADRISKDALDKLLNSLDLTAKYTVYNAWNVSLAMLQQHITSAYILQDTAEETTVSVYLIKGANKYIDVYVNVDRKEEIDQFA